MPTFFAVALFTLVLNLFASVLADRQHVIDEAFRDLAASVPSSASEHSEHNRRHTHSFRSSSDAATGHVIEFDYDVTFRKELVMLEKVDHIHSVAECFKDRIVLHVGAAHDFDWARGHLLTSNEVRCADNEHIGHRIVSVGDRKRGVAGDGSPYDVIELKTEPIALNEILEAGSTIRLVSNKFPSMAAFRNTKSNSVAKTDQQRKRGFLDDVAKFFVDSFNDVEKALETVGSEIVKAAQGVVTIVRLAADYAFTGELRAPPNGGVFYAVVLSGEWNYDDDKLKSKEIIPLAPDDMTEPKAQCVDCYFQFDAGFLFKMVVTHHSKLEDFALLVRGDVRAKLDIDLPAGSRMDLSVDVWEDELVPAQEIRIMIGPIVILIDYSMKVVIGFRGTMVVQNAWHGYASGFGCAELGFEMDPVSGLVAPVDRVVLKYDGKLPSVAVSSVKTAALQVYIKMLNYVRFQRIGGPYIRITPFVEVAIALGDAAGVTCGTAAASDSLALSVNWGTQVAIGGFLRVSLDKEGKLLLYEKVWPPAPVLDFKDELLSVCLIRGSGKRSVNGELDTLQTVAPPSSLAADVLAVGRVWTGLQAFCVSYQEWTVPRGPCRVPLRGFLLNYDTSYTLQLIQRVSADEMIFTLQAVVVFGDGSNPIVPAYDSGRQINPSGDDDGDGVNNADDVCSKTRPGATPLATASSPIVCQCHEKSYGSSPSCLPSQDAARIGCADGQQPDNNDIDRDGAGNDLELPECRFDLDSANLPACSPPCVNSPDLVTPNLPLCSMTTQNVACLAKDWCRVPELSRPTVIKCWVTGLYRGTRVNRQNVFNLRRIDDSGEWPNGAVFLRRCTDFEDIISLGVPVEIQGQFTATAFESIAVSNGVPLADVTRPDTTCPSWSLSLQRGTAQSVVTTGKQTVVGNDAVTAVTPPPAFVDIRNAFTNNRGECKYSDVKPDVDVKTALQAKELLRKAKVLNGAVKNGGVIGDDMDFNGPLVKGTVSSDARGAYSAGFWWFACSLACCLEMYY